ncbi:chaperonin 10-like protein [Paraphoma chrysanthemicola]|uniref:Chaperonin 10-like protein n=1 Tax=Paraphoma chrysanthemicola TaxID=798071 RepID=A0A8K0R1W6_9PLEO|nr:chaperonin 10-like protein [Paraphoma chrysanthemicola]
MSTLPTHRRVFRVTSPSPHTRPTLTLHTEPLPFSLPPTFVLIKTHAISLNYCDADILFGTNPWPTIPHMIPCNDAAGSIISLGSRVTRWHVGDAVLPNVDTANFTGREAGRGWLAANEDGVLADYLLFDESVLVRVPGHLSWGESSVLPCAGLTAWSALKGVKGGEMVSIQGTGGVALVAVKLALERGLRVVLSSSSDGKLAHVREELARILSGW